MTVPMAYRQASARFEDLLAEIAQGSGLTTRNQAYTVLDGVLQAFRRRLTAAQGLAFVQALPPLVGAMFLAGWEPEVEPEKEWDRAAMTGEVKRLRQHHNFAPDSAIADVARVLRRHVEAGAFEAVLARLPDPARAFWTSGDPSAAL